LILRPGDVVVVHAELNRKEERKKWVEDLRERKRR